VIPDPPKNGVIESSRNLDGVELANFCLTNQGFQNLIRQTEINKFNQKQISPLLDMLLKLFKSPTNDTINRALIEMREGEFKIIFRQKSPI